MNIFKFAVFSAVVHTVALATWDAPIVPTYRAQAVLSVGFAEQMPVAASTATKRAAASRRTKTKSTKPKSTEQTTGKKTDVGQSATLSVATPQPPKKMENVTRSKSQLNRNPETNDRSPPPTLARLSLYRTAQTLSVPAPAMNSSMSAPTITSPKKISPVVGARAVRVTVRAPHHLFPADPKLGAVKPVEPAASPATTKGTKETTQALIEGRVRTNLTRYFYYPAIARRRGWQGNVRVGFTVEADGRLTGLHVAQSSGHDVLDKSALKALRRVEQLTEAATMLNGQTITMELPVIYRLEEQ